MADRVVMKFGGTSVGTAEALRLTVRHVLRERRQPLVVVSAVGGVTDLLLGAAGQSCAAGNCEGALQQIHRRHAVIIEDLGLPQELLADLWAELERLLQGVQMLRELTPRIKDQVVSLGERMSARLMAAALQQAGSPARAYSSWELGLITDEQHGRAEPLPEAQQEMRGRLAQLPADEIPVVTGFIAHSPAGEITTLGRGGSDFTAALFGAAAEAAEIQIWTDVPGILRADPRAVPEAQVVPAVNFAEAAELAFFGAKVLHPRTIEPARRQRIPVRVLGTFACDPDDERPTSAQGTLIHDQAPIEPIRALALHQGVQTLHLHSLRMLEAPGFLAQVFAILAHHSVSVDVIATSEVSVSMTFDSGDDGLEADDSGLEAAVDEISSFAEVELVPKRSLLCLVGSGLRQDTSLLARVFDILARAQVPVRVISQGASRINITLVTDPPHGVRAIQALYQELFSSAGTR